MEESDQIFWLSMAGIIVGFCSLALKMCLKSKCSDIDCCSLLKIHRNVDLEEKQMEFEVQHNINDNQSENNPPPQNKRMSFTRILPL